VYIKVFGRMEKCSTSGVENGVLTTSDVVLEEFHVKFTTRTTISFNMIVAYVDDGLLLMRSICLLPLVKRAYFGERSAEKAAQKCYARKKK
jgi:hypothetical protein